MQSCHLSVGSQLVAVPTNTVVGSGCSSHSCHPSADVAAAKRVCLGAALALALMVFAWSCCTDRRARREIAMSTRCWLIMVHGCDVAMPYPLSSRCAAFAAATTSLADFGRSCCQFGHPAASCITNVLISLARESSQLLFAACACSNSCAADTAVLAAKAHIWSCLIGTRPRSP